MNRFIFIIFFIVITSALISCSAFKAAKIINSGDVNFTGHMEKSVPFSLDGHPIIIKTKLNNSSKNYNFILDTGALTLIKQEVADELELPIDLEITAKGSQGKTKNIQLVKLDTINLGGIIVRNCSSGVIQNDSLFPKNIAGILGSNFLRFFTVTIDFKEHEIILTKNSLDKQKSIPVTLEMKHGFAPFLQCIIDDKTKIKAMIDTGTPVTSLNLPLLKNTKEFIQGKVIKATGSTSAGIGGRAAENYVLRLKKIKIGNNIIKNLPVFSHSDNSVQMLIGNDVLTKYKVIIDYPYKAINLIPNGKKFDINPTSFGVAFEKKNGKTFVAGLWENSSIKQSGIQVGDEVLKINSIDTSQLSSLDLIAISMKNESSIMTMELKSKEKTRFLTLRKEEYLSKIK
ncbi:MAG: hypothetical protein CSB21_03480 [Deltaproteobacteria bacterium]|nr:MAG: hypothetical protein CSB21_03480 [Deltaproteobacteria bacterium]